MISRSARPTTGGSSAVSPENSLGVLGVNERREIPLPLLSVCDESETALVREDVPRLSKRPSTDLRITAPLRAKKSPVAADALVAAGDVPVGRPD